MSKSGGCALFCGKTESRLFKLTVVIVLSSQDPVRFVVSGMFYKTFHGQNLDEVSGTHRKFYVLKRYKLIIMDGFELL